MSTSFDPFDVLVAMRPVVPGIAPGVDDDARIDELFRRVCDRAVRPATVRPARAPRRRWPRRTIGAAVAIGLLGASSLAAALVLQSRDAKDPTLVVCWAAASADSARVETRLTKGVSPLEACGGPWTDGTLGTGGPPPSSVCVTSTGELAVVPGADQVCAAFAMTPAQGDVVGPDVDVVDMLRTQLNEVLATECLDQPATEVLIDRVLARDGLRGWTRRPLVPFTAATPCGQVDIDPTSETVLVVPRQTFPPNGSGDSSVAGR